MPYRLFQILGAVTVFVGAFDRLAVLNLHRAAAVVGAVTVGHALLQSHSQGQRLESGAGLISVVDRFVTPLEQLQIPQLLPVGVGVLLARLRQVLLIHLG